MKHRSIISPGSQIISQLSGQQQVKSVPSDQRRVFLASIFFDAQGIFFINYLEKERIISSEYYIVLVVRLKEEIAKNRQQLKNKKVIFQLDNAMCHKSIATMAKPHESFFEVLLHPPYSLDLFPSDYWLFVDLKRIIQGKRFDSNEKVISNTTVEMDCFTGVTKQEVVDI